MYPNGCTTHIYLPMCIADNVVMENTNTMLTLARAKPNKQRLSPEISVTKVEFAKGLAIIPTPKSKND